MVLQVVIDESGNGQPPALGIGGFIASAAQWASFSDEWQTYLDMRPRIAYFKSSEAQTFSGEFLGWSNERRDERVALLHGVILNHAIAAASMIVQQSMFETILRPHQIWETPYQFLTFQLISNITAEQREIGIEEPIDLSLMILLRRIEFLRTALSLTSG